MKRTVRLMVLTILVLFVMPLVLVNAEPQVQEEFVISADGDESTDSIYDFKETLPDDVMFYPDNETHGTGYAESFADVSDWQTWAGNGINTDGDEGYFDVPGDSLYDRYYSNEISFSSGTQHYVEFRVRANVSITQLLLQVYSLDDHAGTTTSVISISFGTTVITRKALFSGSHAVESIGLVVKTSANARIYVDYLRAGDESEMGWQHDGSTTAGVSDNNQVDSTFTYSSDGDILTLNVTRDVGASEAYCDFFIALDTTATSSAVELDYYPFFAVRYKLTGDSNTHYIRLATDEMWVGNPITKDAWTTTRTNMIYTGFSVEKRVWFTVLLRAEQTVQFEVDWAKAYSIANYTITQSGAGTDDYLYVDNGELVYSGDADVIELNHDPALTIDTSTYTVLNVTRATGVVHTSKYTGSWSSWSSEARYATGTGTLSDVKIKFISACTLSAIKFIEDGTAPVISDFWIVPYTPTEEDNVTLAIYETDVGAGTYTVTFNAVDYPDGFVDVDMDAVESSNKDGLWSYTIDSSDLPAGYYVFEVIASDGANEGTELTIFEVIDVTDNIFYLLFLSPEVWGYLGPFALVFIGYVLIRKDKFLVVLLFVVECLFV